MPEKHTLLIDDCCFSSTIQATVSFSRRAPIRRPMHSFPFATRLPRIALYVPVFVAFAIGIGGQNVRGSCGDYLEHSRLGSKKDLTHDSLPLPGCKGNCRSAPTLPPVEPTRIAVPQRQHLNFQPTDTSSNTLQLRKLEFSDDALPSSPTLEVTTPPPILNA